MIDAYIITIKGNEISERLSKRCQESCEAVGQPYHVWDAFDGTSGMKVVPPENYEKFLNGLKVSSDNLTVSEIAVFLSHASLWYKCAIEDTAMIILEHDTVFVKKYEPTITPNLIINLAKKNNAYAFSSYDYKHPSSSMHSYVIEPFAARRLLANALVDGMFRPVDFMISRQYFYIHNEQEDPVILMESTNESTIDASK